jgi:hypothetical protein
MDDAAKSSSVVPWVDAKLSRGWTVENRNLSSTNAKLQP